MNNTILKEQKIPKVNADINMSIHNKFEIEVIDTRTGEVRQRAQAFNTICDNLWLYLFSSDSHYFNSIHYGRGTGTPSPHDTSLFDTISYNDSWILDTSKVNWIDGVYSVTKGIQLQAATAAGETITEVGIAYNNYGATLCTHAMLQDMDGNPTSIAKTDTDVVKIYATVYAHWDPAGYNDGKIYFNGTSVFSWLCGAVTNNYPDGSFYYYLTDPQHGGARTSSSSSLTVDKTNKTATVKAYRLQVNDIESGGFRHITSSGIVFRIGGDWYKKSTISKEHVGTGDGITKDFSLAFPFAYNAKVYIDGIETTDFTLDYGPNSRSSWACYFEPLYAQSTPDRLLRSNKSVYSNSNTETYSHIFYNPMYAVGLKHLYLAKRQYSITGKIYASNDLSNWEDVYTITTTNTDIYTVTLPAKYQHYKYWKLDPGFRLYDNRSSSYPERDTMPLDSFTGNVLHLTTAPELNAHIQIDYDCDCVKKDINHVFDFEYTIHVGEYVAPETTE